MKILSLSLIAVVGLLLTSCEKDSPFVPVNQEQSKVHVLNAFGGIGSMDVEFHTLKEKKVLAGDVDFMQSWPKGGYASLLTETNFDSTGIDNGTLLEIRTTNARNGLEVIPWQALRLNAELKTTVAIIDSFGKAKIVRTADLYEKVSDTLVNLRFMNLSYLNNSVTMRTADSTIVIDRLNYLNYSSFRQVHPGSYHFLFIEDSSQGELLRLSNIELKGGRNYSFFLSQKNGQLRAAVEELKE